MSNVIEKPARRAAAAGQQAGIFGDACAHHGADALIVTQRIQRAHLRLRIERIAQAQRCDPLHDPFQHRIVERFVQ